MSEVDYNSIPAAEIGEIINILSSDTCGEQEYRTVVGILERMYRDSEVRHSYAYILSVLQSMFIENKQTSIEALSNNMLALYDYVNENVKAPPVRRGFFKLYDHVMLEINRFGLYSYLFEYADDADGPAHDSATDKSINKLKKYLRSHEKDINKIKDAMSDIMNEKDERVTFNQNYDGVMTRLNSYDEKIERSTLSSITTLTIFSAVVLAFSGGVTFESSVLNNLSNGSIPTTRLVLTISLTGFILFNTIFLLLYVVSKMSDRFIGSKCKHECSSDTTDEKRHPCGSGVCSREKSEYKTSLHEIADNLLCRLWHKYFYVTFVNAVLLVLILCCVIFELVR